MKEAKTIQQVAEELHIKGESEFISGFDYAKEHPELLRELFADFWGKDTEYFNEKFDLWIEQRNKQQ